MMKTLTEYDYEPGEPVDYVTLIIYQSLSQKMAPLNFFWLFCSIILWLFTYKYSYNILGLSCLR